MKVFEKEYESKFNDCRKKNVDEEENYINEKLGGLPIHSLIKQIKLFELLWDFDAVTLYPSAIWDEKSNHCRIETGYAYTEDMNEELVENFNTGNLTKGRAILKIKFYNPKKSIVQHFPVKEKN